ncbi:MAG: transposase [Arsenophonus sp. NEOnobi-MAG3]
MVRFSTKYPSAMKQLEKDREELLPFYNFPSEQTGGPPIKPRNPIESTFATVRLRRADAKEVWFEKNNPFNVI